MPHPEPLVGSTVVPPTLVGTPRNADATLGS